MTTLTRAALLNEVASLLADNSTGQITPSDVRRILNDTLNSVWTLLDSQATSGTITFSAIALGITGPLYGNGASAVTALAPGQIPGSAVNDDASLGNVGEYVTATGSGVALTTATPLTIASISLTAGDWDVAGEMFFNPAGTTTIAAIAAGTNTASNTLPTAPAGGLSQIAATLTTGAPQALSVGRDRYSLAGLTTVYLVAQASFGVSTMAATGKISARRAR